MLQSDISVLMLAIVACQVEMQKDMSHQECINCKTTYSVDEIVYFCKKCGDILEIKFDATELAETAKKATG